MLKLAHRSWNLSWLGLIVDGSIFACLRTVQHIDFLGFIICDSFFKQSIRISNEMTVNLRPYSNLYLVDADESSNSFQQLEENNGEDSFHSRSTTSLRSWSDDSSMGLSTASTSLGSSLNGGDQFWHIGGQDSMTLSLRSDGSTAYSQNRRRMTLQRIQEIEDTGGRGTASLASEESAMFGDDSLLLVNHLRRIQRPSLSSSQTPSIYLEDLLSPTSTRLGSSSLTTLGGSSSAENAARIMARLTLQDSLLQTFQPRQEDDSTASRLTISSSSIGVSATSVMNSLTEQDSMRQNRLRVALGSRPTV